MEERLVLAHESRHGCKARSPRPRGGAARLSVRIRFTDAGQRPLEG
jgi:hypothetical protein